MLDLWNTTEHPELHNSKIINGFLECVINVWVVAHQVINLTFVDNSMGNKGEDTELLFLCSLSQTRASEATLAF